MDLAKRVAGRHFFITGASGGLGEHFARLAASCGAAITVGARRVDRLQALVEELQAAGACHARVVELDVTDEGSIAAAIAAAVADGAPPLATVVNNAGLADTSPALNQPIETFDRILDTNLRGAWCMSTAAARYWRGTGTGGAIVNVASILGLRVGSGVAAYAVSKAALVQMTKAHALEWARYDIRVNALCPGYISTDMNAAFFQSEPGLRMIDHIPMRRLGCAEELDGAFLLMASDASSWMTGSILAVDGGHLVSGL